MVPSIKLSQCFKTFCIGHPSIDFKQVEISSFCNTTFSKPFSNFFVFIFNSLNVSHNLSFKVSSQNFDLGYSTLYATKCNLPHYRRNELCYLGFVFAIDRKLVVVNNTHGVQLGGLHNMATSFLSFQCLCHMNIWEGFFSLRTCFHPNIIKPIHT